MVTKFTALQKVAGISVLFVKCGVKFPDVICHNSNALWCLFLSAKLVFVLRFKSLFATLRIHEMVMKVLIVHGATEPNLRL